MHTTAIQDGRLIRNVADGVPLPLVVTKPKRFLTHDQVQALAEACAPYGTLIKILAYAGLPWGEWVAHLIRRVDLERRRIEVVEAISSQIQQRASSRPPCGVQPYVPSAAT